MCRRRGPAVRIRAGQQASSRLKSTVSCPTSISWFLQDHRGQLYPLSPLLLPSVKRRLRPVLFTWNGGAGNRATKRLERKVAQTEPLDVLVLFLELLEMAFLIADEPFENLL